MDCFNHNCLWKENNTSNYNRCECIACPNRWNNDVYVISDCTLTKERYKEKIKKIEDPNYGIGNWA